MVTGVTNNTATAQTKTTAQNIQDQKNQFLLMLTTQLQNQDPTSPMDTNQMTAQLVAFTQVEQQIDMNNKLQKLIDLQSGTGNVINDAVKFIGSNIETSGNQINFDGKTTNNLSYTLPSDASALTVGVYDKNGQLVTSITDAPKTAGKHALTWAGKDDKGNTVPAGTYTLKVSASDKSSTAITNIKTTTTGIVTGVEKTDEGVFLKVGSRNVSQDDILSIDYNYYNLKDLKPDESEDPTV